MVALLGATGSGKSSIISLVPRFYDATRGQILIDGHDVRGVTLESLRSQIGIVLQETRLFSGTVRENIAYGRPDASDEDVVHAARAAAAHDFITSFPKGYDTPVAELGVSLSGGQKQRIAIARALLMDPRILILDDSTSSVDLQTEAQIQDALARLMEGRTSFVIAQRISTARNADLIIVLDRGRVVATGRHRDLLETEPIYSDIYYSQLVEDVPAAPVAPVAGEERSGPGSPRAKRWRHDDDGRPASWRHAWVKRRTRRTTPGLRFAGWCATFCPTRRILVTVALLIVLSTVFTSSRPFCWARPSTATWRRPRARPAPSPRPRARSSRAFWPWWPPWWSSRCWTPWPAEASSS